MRQSLPGFFYTLTIPYGFATCPLSLLAWGGARLSSGFLFRDEGYFTRVSAQRKPMTTLRPICTITLSTTILQETIGYAQIAGTFWVVAGVVLLGWRGK